LGAVQPERSAAALLVDDDEAVSGELLEAIERGVVVDARKCRRGRLVVGRPPAMRYFSSGMVCWTAKLTTALDPNGYLTRSS
jgi:hypothetical protein